MGRLGFRLGSPLPRLGGEEGGLTFTFGLEDLGLLLPLGFEILDWRTPSASSTSARFWRSAFIWAFIASTNASGGRTSLISMRVTLMPRGRWRHPWCAVASR